VLAYALYGDEGVNGIESILRERAQGLERGKVSKYDAYYAPQSPVPFGLWEYRCETCRFYDPDGGGDGNGAECEIVGHGEDWFGGENVHPSAWCALWLPEEGRGWFEYVTDRLEGTGGSG
jgi:hypothetical protein